VRHLIRITTVKNSSNTTLLYIINAICFDLLHKKEHTIVYTLIRDNQGSRDQDHHGAHCSNRLLVEKIIRHLGRSESIHYFVNKFA
jgi:hypothetical protein